MIANALIIGGFVFLFMFIGYLISESIEIHKLKNEEKICEKFEKYLKERNKNMKYIRTKDGVFENEYVHIEVDEDGYAIMEYKGDFYDAPEKVKQADTIEELCDVFVLYDITAVFPHEEYEIYKDWEKAKDEYEVWHDREDCVDLFGAIWTDKGLIYVAKINEKGEFELL